MITSDERWWMDIVKLWFTTMFYVGFIPWQKVL